MLYTIVPLDSIFKNDANQEIYNYEEYSLNNCILQLYKGNKSNEYKIKRVISTDPTVYLQDVFQPGSIINQVQLNKYKKE